jgi:hypothetical protein
MVYRFPTAARTLAASKELKIEKLFEKICLKKDIFPK